ncbi:MAG: hypothetical protein K2V38_07275, partial [Gemmataceae bacterium]|nr:hypothetical protein [Gemmataceae bacterium]
MPDIRVTCPACKTQLEIDAAHEGQEVECGNCLEVFVASTKKPKPATRDARDDRDDDRDDDRGRSRGRDDRDDRDDDENDRRR